MTISTAWPPGITDVSLTLTQLKHYIEVNKYEFPCVVGRTTDGRFHMLFADSELPDVVHNPTKFVNALRKRAVDAGMAWK